MYLILKNGQIVDGVATEPTMDGNAVVWGNSRMSGATYTSVPDGTWEKSMGYRKTWDGSVVGDMPALPEDPDTKYAGIGQPSLTDIFMAFTAVLSTADYAAFRAHGMYDALSSATVVDFDDPEGLVKIKTGLAALVSGTSITQEQIDTILAALKTAPPEA